MIKEDLENLVELQKIDTSINNLEEEINASPIKKKKIEKETQNALETGEITKKEYKKLQINKKEKEFEVEGIENEIKKLQARLNEVKTNKEYSSLLSETDNLKKKKNELEDVLLSLMEQDEVLSKQLSDITEKNNILIKKNELKILEEDSKIEKVKEELKIFREKREKILPSISKNVYSIYDRILKGKKNRVAICELVEGNCSGCRVFVPIYLEEKVKEKKEIVNCENCSRILY